MKHNFSCTINDILVRPLKNYDIELLRKWRNKQENNIYLKQIAYIQPQDQVIWFKKYENDTSTICFAIEETKLLKCLIGSASLYNFCDNEAEFGKFLIGHKQAHGKKAGVNALKAIVKVGFEQIGLSSMTLHCYKDNISALNVYKEVGFTIENEKYISGKCNYPNGIEYMMRIRKCDSI